MLEDRATPATFTVNTTLDVVGVQDKFSLREAIHAINNADAGPHQIEFNLNAMGHFPPMRLMVGLLSPLEPINRSVTIDGLGVVDVSRGPFTLPMEEEPPKFRIFEINAGVSVTFQDLGVIGGNVTGDGGGILNNGSLTLDGCKVNDNAASGSGGGVRNNHILMLDVTTVQNNTAGAAGGGIANYGFLNVQTSTIKQNIAADDGGGLYYSSSDEFLTLNTTTVRDNSAAGHGGGVYIDGGGNGTISVTDSSIEDNHSTGVTKQGGGMYINAGTFFISGGTVSGNSSRGSGGGLFAATNALLDIEGTSFSSNQTETNGGGVALDPSLIQQITMTNCTFSENSSGDAQNGLGGGVYMGGSSGSLVLTNCQFNSNAAYRGGGLYTTRNTDIVGGRFIYNSALEGGGAIYGGEANLSIDVYFDGSGWQTTELSDNEALENMGEGIAWEEGSGGILIWSFLTGNNADDIDYV